MATNNQSLPRREVVTALVIVTLASACMLIPWQLFLSNKMDLNLMMQGPSGAHPLGTDHVGRDLFLRLRNCFFLTVLPLWGVSTLATLGGFGAGFLHIVFLRPRRWLRPLDHLLSLGALFLVSIPVGISAFSLSLLQARVGFWSVATATSMIFFLRAHQQLWGWYRESARLGYWQANQILGGSLCYRIWQYGVLRTWRSPILETLRFHLQIVIGIEASLSYLGFGIQEPEPSFGNILAAHLPDYLRGQMHVVLAVMAGMALCAFLPTAIALLGRAAYIKRLSRLKADKRLSFS